MKKTIIALAAMFAVALGANAQKFGHVDTQSIMQSLPELTKANGELQAKAQELDNQMKEMLDEFQKNYEAYEKTKATLAPKDQQTREAELQEQYTKIQNAAQQNQQELQKLQQEKMQPIQQKIMTAIQNVGKAGQYTYIFEASAPLYTGAGSKDVTADVKAEINKIK